MSWTGVAEAENTVLVLALWLALRSVWLCRVELLCMLYSSSSALGHVLVGFFRV